MWISERADVSPYKCDKLWAHCGVSIFTRRMDPGGDRYVSLRNLDERAVDLKREVCSSSTRLNELVSISLTVPRCPLPTMLGLHTAPLCQHSEPGFTRYDIKFRVNTPNAHTGNACAVLDNSHTGNACACGARTAVSIVKWNLLGPSPKWPKQRAPSWFRHALHHRVCTYSSDRRRSTCARTCRSGRRRSSCCVGTARVRVSCCLFFGESQNRAAASSRSRKQR